MGIPNSITNLRWTLMIEWYGFGVVSKWMPKRHVLKKHWITCSKYDNHPRVLVNIIRVHV